MGINVIKKAVQIDDTHHKKVNTSVEENPTVSDIGGVPVFYIFTRSKHNNDKGDGNPLIYAMKGLRGYKIVPMYRRMIIKRSEEIVEKMELKGDVVVPVPSGNGFCAEVAGIVSNVTSLPVFSPSFIRKKNFGEMYSQYARLPIGLMPAEIREYKSQLKVWSSGNPERSVSMKEVSPQIRHLFDPFIRSDEGRCLEGKDVILVDDLLSSGSSLLGSARVCSEVGAESLTGVCFLSALGRDVKT